MASKILYEDTGTEIIIYNQPDCELPKSFFEGRFIPNFHPESLDYMQWWDEQIRRVEEGWSDGGFSMNGVMYYHINFKKINMLDKNGRPMVGHPYFAYEDQQLFEDVQTARDNGKGLLLITGRGFGKSFGATTVAEHELITYPASEVIISASTSIYADNTWSKMLLSLQDLPDELRPSFLALDMDYLETGRKGTGKDKGKVFGDRSKAWKVIYGKDPGKTRGTRPNIHIFEEIGSWTGSAKLKECYRMTEASWWRGAYFTCFPFLIGTGGEMKTGGSEDARSMFWNPEAYNLMAFEREENGHMVKAGRFVEAYRKFGGFYEKSGFSDEEGARKKLEDRREKKKSDQDTYLQECMEFPFNPNEAFMVTGGSYFDIPALEARFEELEQMRLRGQPATYRCDLKPIYNDSKKIVGVREVRDDKGPFEIAEPPLWENPEWQHGVIPNLYVSSCDSFDAVEQEITDDQSRGCCKVFKRFWKANMTGNMFVASITLRTRNGTEFYEKTVLLNMWYHSKMLYEHTKTGIGQYYITNKLHHMLYPRPKLETVDVIKRPTSTNTYGITMPERIKRHAIKRYAEYLDNYLENVYFSSQLLDAISFRFGDSSFDETMAAAIGILADDDMYDLEIRETAKQQRHFPRFVRVKGKLQFI